MDQVIEHVYQVYTRSIANINGLEVQYVVLGAEDDDVVAPSSILAMKLARGAPWRRRQVLETGDSDD